MELLRWEQLFISLPPLIPMSELQFPEDHHLSYPHVRLSKRKFLVFESDQLYYAKIQSDHSIYTPIIHRNEIRKLEVQMIHSNNGNFLKIIILMRPGKKKIYHVSPKKIAYKQSDWVQISDFFLALDFLPSPVPTGKSLREAPKIFYVNGIYRYFPVGDRIFELCKNPEFEQELETQNLSFLPLILIILGGIGLVLSVTLGVLAYQKARYVVWILSVLTLASLGYGIFRISKFRKKQNIFIQRYDLAYYFK